jgi:hypothetical protein
LKKNKRATKKIDEGYIYRGHGFSSRNGGGGGVAIVKVRIYVWKVTGDVVGMKSVARVRTRGERYSVLC